MKHIALILGLTLPVTLLSCAKAEAQTAKQNVELDSLEEKVAALEAQLEANLKYEKDDDGNERWYDSKGYLIHYKDSTGYERWYDSKGNLIHEKRSYGYEAWHEYDSKGYKIHYKNSNGDEAWHEYDSKGNLIHYKDCDGDEKWYDSNGNEIHEKRSDGYEWWAEYDSDGNLILKKDSNGNVEESIVEYDSKGNLIHLKEIGRCEFLLNENGDLIYANTRGLGCDWWQMDGVHYEYDPKNPNHRKDLRDGSDWYFKKDAQINVPFKGVKLYEDGGIYTAMDTEVWKWESENLGDVWCKYDEKGRIISFWRNYEKFSGHEWGAPFVALGGMEYDSNGRIIYYDYGENWGDGNYSYDYYDNGNLKEWNYFYTPGAGSEESRYIFDIDGNCTFIFLRSHSENATYMVEYKDGEKVKSIVQYAAGAGSLADDEAVYSIDSLGNVKINEDILKDEYEWIAIDSRDWPDKSVKEAYYLDDGIRSGLEVPIIYYY